MNNNNLPEDLGEIKPTEDVGEENMCNGLPKNLSFRDFMVTLDHNFSVFKDW